MHIAHGGNCDIQYMQNSAGALEYCASYSSKQDEPDMKILDNIFTKELAQLKQSKGSVTRKDELSIAAKSVVAAQQIGAVQVCYNLLNLQHVISSRRVDNINALHRKHVAVRLVTNKQELDCMDPQESATLQAGPGSNLGKRDAYAAVVKQQWQTHGICHVTFFALLTSYSLHRPSDNEKKTLKEPPLLQLDENGMISRFKTHGNDDVPFQGSLLTMSDF